MAQFSSYQFVRFAREWDFTHDPSSPKHAKSNGMAESAVKTVKGLFIQESASKQGGPIPCAHGTSFHT